MDLVWQRVGTGSQVKALTVYLPVECSVGVSLQAGLQGSSQAGRGIHSGIYSFSGNHC